MLCTLGQPTTSPSDSVSIKLQLWLNARNRFPFRPPFAVPSIPTLEMSENGHSQPLSVSPFRLACFASCPATSCQLVRFHSPSCPIAFSHTSFSFWKCRDLYVHVSWQSNYQLFRCLFVSPSTMALSFEILQRSHDETDGSKKLVSRVTQQTRSTCISGIKCVHVHQVDQYQ